MNNCQGKMDASRSWHGKRITFCYRMKMVQEYRRGMHKGEVGRGVGRMQRLAKNMENRRQFGKMANSSTTTPGTWGR